MEKYMNNLNNMSNDNCYQLADYILNHYDKNSHADKLVLAADLEKRFNSEYSKGIYIATSVAKGADIKDTETLVCNLQDIFSAEEHTKKIIRRYVFDDTMIKINESDKIIDYFDNHKGHLQVLCPGSGSWKETLYSKEHYKERMNAWNGGTETWIPYIHNPKNNHPFRYSRYS